MCSNSFFKGSCYLQIHNTALEPKNAYTCSYADSAMGEIDREARFCGPI